MSYDLQAYNYWMTANMKFEVQDWQTAIDLYTQARSIYEKLAGAFMDEDTRMLYLQRVEEISPNIRYCAYNLGQGGLDINDLMKMRSNATGQDMLAAKIDVSILCLERFVFCLLYTSPSPRDATLSRMPSSA